MDSHRWTQIKMEILRFAQNDGCWLCQQLVRIEDSLGKTLGLPAYLAHQKVEKTWIPVPDQVEGMLKRE